MRIFLTFLARSVRVRPSPKPGAAPSEPRVLALSRSNRSSVTSRSGEVFAHRRQLSRLWPRRLCSTFWKMWRHQRPAAAPSTTFWRGSHTVPRAAPAGAESDAQGRGACSGRPSCRSSAALPHVLLVEPVQSPTSGFGLWLLIASLRAGADYSIHP